MLLSLSCGGDVVLRRSRTKPRTSRSVMEVSRILANTARVIALREPHSRRAADCARLRARPSRVHTYCVCYVWFLYSRLASLLTERGYCVDLPQRRCSFPASTSATNASTVAGTVAPRCLARSASLVSAIAASPRQRGDRNSAHNSLHPRLRAAFTARVSFDGVTIESHDRYSPQMTFPRARRASVRQRIAKRRSLT
jgi:hypothetical protein